MTVPARTALVTGASAGIGESFARFLAAEGHSLLLVARRVDRLQQLAQELRQAHDIRCDVFAVDLTDPGASVSIINHAQENNITIDVLINNAGLAGNAAFANTSWESLNNEIQLMITTLTELTHRVLPGMQARQWGRIVNLSSLAALSPPGASLLYSAIKSYVLVLSQSLNMELKPQGIHVTALCPGFTKSEFHDVMGTRDATSRLPGILWQEAEDVVREGWETVMKGKPVCVPGSVNKLIAGSVRPLPMGLQYFLGQAMNPFKQSIGG